MVRAEHTFGRFKQGKIDVFAWGLSEVCRAIHRYRAFEQEQVQHPFEGAFSKRNQTTEGAHIHKK